MDKLVSKNTNLHMKTVSQETVASMGTDLSTLALSKPRQGRGKRYIDKSYLRKIHTIEQSLTQNSFNDTSYSIPSNELSQQTKALITKLYQKYVASEASQASSAEGFSSFLENCSCRVGPVQGPDVSSQLSFGKDTVLFCTDQFSEVDWGTQRDLSVIDSNEEFWDCETSSVIINAPSYVMELLPENSDDSYSMYDSRIALERAKLAGIQLKDKPITESEYKNQGPGRCKINYVKPSFKPLQKLVTEESLIENSMDTESLSMDID